LDREARKRRIRDSTLGLDVFPENPLSGTKRQNVTIYPSKYTVPDR